MQEESIASTEQSSPSHDQFRRLMRCAQRKCRISKKNVDVVWRGYKTTVTPDSEEYTDRTLEIMLQGIIELMNGGGKVS